jgi:hypothetical protein
VRRIVIAKKPRGFDADEMADRIAAARGLVDIGGEEQLAAAIGELADVAEALLRLVSQRTGG